MSKAENPSAFPFQPTQADGELMSPEYGMTLRDWFAGHALAGLLSDGSQRLINDACKDVPDFLDMGPVKRAEVVNSQLATGSYAIADAMLAERERQP